MDIATLNTLSWFIVGILSAIGFLAARAQRRWGETTRKELQKEIDDLKGKLTMKEDANTLLFTELSAIKDRDISTVNNEARAEFYLLYLAMCSRERELFLFLNQHYPDALQLGQLENRSLIAISMGILLQEKQELEIWRRGR